MSYSEAAHEASKIVIAGGMVAGGIFLEEAMEKLISGVALLEPISSIVIAVTVGSLTAITIAMSAWIIDSLDVFRVVENKEHNFVVRKLDNEIQDSLNRSENLILKIGDIVL